MGLYVRQLLLGPMENFVYLVGAPEAAEVAVVDPAWDVAAIEQAARSDGKRIACAILSHCHFDHVNGVPELLEAARDPLALGGRLHQDLGLRPTTEHLDQAMTLSANAHVDQLTVIREDRDLTFPLPQVHANMVHG